MAARRVGDAFRQDGGAGFTVVGPVRQCFKFSYILSACFDYTEIKIRLYKERSKDT